MVYSVAENGLCGFGDVAGLDYCSFSCFGEGAVVYFKNTLGLIARNNLESSAMS